MNIQDRLIDAHTPTFIIAEVGVNHNGEIDQAKRLIQEAKKAGADAVKFQTYQTEELVSESAEQAPYQVNFLGEKTSQKTMLKGYELSLKDHQVLIEEAHKEDIIFLSTPFDIPSVEILKELQLPAFKVSSGDLNNLPLLRYIAQCHKPIILSTGMSTIELIHESIQAIQQINKDIPIAILHCTTAYPAPYRSVNLKAITTMKNIFHNHIIGYSDHTEGIEVSIGAVALGAKIIEKHITLSHALAGPDHKASSTPNQFMHMVQSIRNIEQSLGDGHKIVMDCEKINQPFGRKGIKAKTYIQKGDIITTHNIAIKRPEIGLKPKHFESIINRTVAVRDILPEEPIKWDMLEAK